MATLELAGRLADAIKIDQDHQIKLDMLRADANQSDPTIKETLDELLEELIEGWQIRRAQIVEILAKEFSDEEARQLIELSALPVMQKFRSLAFRKKIALAILPPPDETSSLPN